MATEIRVPTLGESVTEATIGKWFKKAGEAVAADEPIVELETDKVTIEVPAPAAGVLSEIIAKDGETVGVGAILGTIVEGGAKAAPQPRQDTAVAQASAPTAASTTKEAAAQLTRSALDFLDMTRQFGAAELEQYASELSGQLPELFVHLPAPARAEVLARLDSLAREHPLAAVRDRLNALQPTLLAIEDDMRAKSTGAEPILTGALP